MCRFISHSSYVWRIDHQEHRHERWKYLTATKMLNWMRCDGKCTSGHGMDSTTAPSGLREANTSLESIGLVQEKLLWSYSWCSIVLHISQTAPSPWEGEEPNSLCQLNDTLVFLPNTSSKMLFQTILMQNSSKYNPLLSAPLPKVFPLVPEAISKTNMKHYHIQIHTEITSWGSAATQEFPRAPISKPNLDHVSWICDTFQVNGIRNIYILLMPMKQ